LSKASLSVTAKTVRATLDDSSFEFKKVGLKELSIRFQRIHQYIWSKEKKSPSAAFEELIKVIFVKLQKDKLLHNQLGPHPNPSYKNVVFSTHWITGQTENDSPINDPLFKNLVQSLEADIKRGSKKRFFDEDENINLSRDTIRWIVRELEHIDLVSMEEDVHGRMFETFFDATIRGRELGQFFTPRDVVELMVSLANITVTKTTTSTVLDACCGSGGFLIAAMGRMLKEMNGLVGITNQERSRIDARIKNETLFGIDAGSDPAIHRIARMNMFLHEDGGSHIYHADSLDKRVGQVGRQTIDNEHQLEEIRKMLVTDGKRFDVILSNPPFSLKYSIDDDGQAEVLDQYEMRLDRDNGKVLKALLSSVMFLERYKDLVSPDGEILAIIDDSVLSGQSFRHVRVFIRENFIIIGIISLPGDAFRRASARVKTSILILRPRQKDEVQSDVFMESAISPGLEEKIARRIGLRSADLDSFKKAEIARIESHYRSYRAGRPGPGVIPASSLVDRLDVKFCIGDRGRKISRWRALGLDVTTIGDVLELQSDRGLSVLSSDAYQFLRVNYGGEVIEGEFIEGAECSYSILYRVREWDILLSNMGVGRGAVGIAQPYHAGKYVSNEYTIVRGDNKEEAVYYSTLLRTKEVLGDILATTTGMNRGRIQWENIATVCVPKYLSPNADIKKIVSDLESLWLAHAEFTKSRATHIGKVVSALDVDADDSHERWLAFKPPEQQGHSVLP